MSYAPTPQQQDAIKTLIAMAVGEMLQLRACAGSGKTSTLVLMAEACQVPSLYICFNRSNADEAALKFPKWVECRSSHSKAYATFGAKLRNKLQRPRGGYRNVAGTASEIAQFFTINDVVYQGAVALTGACLGLLVKNTVQRFEQSADDVLGYEHLYMKDVAEKLDGDKDAINYVRQQVLFFAQALWAERVNVNSIVLATHDTYLKLFQLSKPVFHGVEVLYVDEFQDTTPCVMDIVMNQRAHMKVVVVGDSRQAIYGWRGAVNAMEALAEHCTIKMLTKSFRYGQAVADVATAVLRGDMEVMGFEKIESVTGRMGIVDRSQPYTRLFRTNAALLAEALEEIRIGTPIAIEIDTNDFVKLLESAMSLFSRNKKGVKHDKVVPCKDWDELLKEAENDGELRRIAKAVEGGQAEDWLQLLARFQNAPNPHVTFTTAHKSKGREWKQVIVECDFKDGRDESGEFVGLPVEEENLLYVACTRAQERLEYNVCAHNYINEWEPQASYVEGEEVTLGVFETIDEAIERLAA
jgi:superfamily I DNA/RNA helicase